MVILEPNTRILFQKLRSSFSWTNFRIAARSGADAVSWQRGYKSAQLAQTMTPYTIRINIYIYVFWLHTRSPSIVYCYFLLLFLSSFLFIKSQLVQVHAPSSCEPNSTHCTILQPHNRKTMKKRKIRRRRKKTFTNTHRDREQKIFYIAKKKSECVRKLHPFFFGPSQLFSTSGWYSSAI